MNALALYYGTAATSLVHVVPDSVHAGMWRLTWPDGETSDMANLSRIKDAAVVLCERGPPERNGRRFKWKRSRTAPQPHPCVFGRAA